MSYGRIRYDKNKKPYIILEFRRIDPKTRKTIYRSKKEILDDSLTPAKQKKQADLIDEKFIQECQKEMELGISEKNYTYAEFCEMYLEHLKEVNSLSSYQKCCINSKKVINELGQIKLKDIDFDTVDSFYSKINKMKKIEENIKFKPNANEILKAKRLTQSLIVNKFNIQRETLRKGLLGHNVSKIWAENFAKTLNISFDKLFQVEIIKEDIAYNTKRVYISFFKASLAYAVKKRLIERNYASAEYVDAPKNKNPTKRTKCMNKEEFLSLYKFVINYPDIRIKNAFLLLLSTGMRKEELTGLTWDDVDLTNKTINIRNTVVYINKKGNHFSNKTKNPSSTRVIAISDESIESLKEYKEYCNEKIVQSKFLFSRKNGDVISPDTINFWLNKLLKENNMNHYTVHSLRHTYASLMIEETPSIIAVSRRIGHSKVSTTTDIYGHVVSNLDRQIANTLPNEANSKKDNNIISILTKCFENGNITLETYKKIIEQLN